MYFIKFSSFLLRKDFTKVGIDFFNQKNTCTFVVETLAIFIILHKQWLRCFSRTIVKLLYLVSWTLFHFNIFYVMISFFQQLHLHIKTKGVNSKELLCYLFHSKMYAKIKLWLFSFNLTKRPWLWYLFFKTNPTHRHHPQKL